MVAAATNVAARASRRNRDNGVTEKEVIEIRQWLFSSVQRSGVSQHTSRSRRDNPTRYRHQTAIMYSERNFPVMQRSSPSCRQERPDRQPQPRYAGVMPDSTIAVVLAAGAGSRFLDAQHKLLAELPAIGDEPAERVASRSIRHAVDAAIGRVVVVTGSVQLDLPGDLIERHNPRWAAGQATSLQAGLAAARELGADAVVIGLADQPAVPATAWRRVAEHRGPIAVATYDGERGNPVRLASEIWPLLPEEGDEGARRIMRVHADLVREVPCTGSGDDIDTVEDLRRWQRS